MLAQALSVVPGVAVVVINVLLNLVLRKLTAFERHLSSTQAQYTHTRKLFYSQFINTALVILVVQVWISSLRTELLLF